MPLTIVDSDILINVARGDVEAINCVLRLEKTSDLAISAACANGVSCRLSKQNRVKRP